MMYLTVELNGIIKTFTFQRRRVILSYGLLIGLTSTKEGHLRQARNRSSLGGFPLSDNQYTYLLNQYRMALKDQGAIPKESQDELWNRALDIFIESVHKPDSSLRTCAHNQKCYNELMWIRDDIIEHLNTLRRNK